jgi:peptidoglycan/xylan/chitin deacetylase (PgdA/CDA1 family)
MLKPAFFALEKMLQNIPAIYEQIIAKGHTVGNHTQHHVNGWYTDR